MNVLLQIISHRWFVGNDPHPSKDAIAERMGKHPRTVQAYLSSLERKGFLRRAQWYKPHKCQDTNGYDLAGCRHPWRYPKATLDFGRPEKVFDSTGTAGWIRTTDLLIHSQAL
jgi:predicted ArsR family transcriptional regulator